MNPGLLRMAFKMATGKAEPHREDGGVVLDVADVVELVLELRAIVPPEPAVLGVEVHRVDGRPAPRLGQRQKDRVRSRRSRVEAGGTRNSERIRDERHA